MAFVKNFVRWNTREELEEDDDSNDEKKNN